MARPRLVQLVRSARITRLAAATAVAVTLGGLAGGLGMPASTNPFLASPAASPSATPAAEMVWKCDPAHCMALFRIHHVGAGQFWGMFDGVTGGFTWDEGSDAAPTFDVTLDVESVHTGTEKLDRTIKSPQFFNAKENPKVTFKSTGGEKSGENTWTITGDLSMHGVTKPITANLELTGVAGNPVQKKAGFEATFTVNRSDFDMNWGVKNKALGDEVRLVIGLEGNWEK